MLRASPLTDGGPRGFTLTKLATRSHKIHHSPATRVRIRCSSSAKLDDTEAVSARGSVCVLQLGERAAICGNFEKVWCCRVNASIQMHLSEPEAADALDTVKIQTLQGASRAELQAAWKDWIQSYMDSAGKIPPGNSQGNQVWVGKRPASAQALKPAIKLTPGGNKDLTIPMKELVDKLVKDTKGVLLFMKGTPAAPQCGFSARVVSIFQSIGCQFEAVDVLDQEYNPGLREIIKEYSAWPTIPQVYHDGEFVGGADIVEEMLTSGELQKLIKASSS